MNHSLLMGAFSAVDKPTAIYNSTSVTRCGYREESACESRINVRTASSSVCRYDNMHSSCTMTLRGLTYVESVCLSNRLPF